MSERLVNLPMLNAEELAEIDAALTVRLRELAAVYEQMAPCEKRRELTRRSAVVASVLTAVREALLEAGR